MHIKKMIDMAPVRSSISNRFNVLLCDVFSFKKYVINIFYYTDVDFSLNSFKSGSHQKASSTPS